MEELPLFVLAILFGGFFLFFLMMCCIRLFVYLTDDKKFLCFKSKAALRRRRIQLSLLPEVNVQRVENLGYIAAPDENINEYTICQPYVYEDGRSTGMRMIANLPMALAFTTRVYSPYSISPNLSQNLELHHPFQHYQQELSPPPNYLEAHLQIRNSNEKLDDYMERVEPPPPSYDECMKRSRSNSIAESEHGGVGRQLPCDTFAICASITIKSLQ
ncbi:uncharacterized protein LOC118433858 isoform X2 [Folsomia candida]|uniref:Uncharacterized protein n=1 Tax=Folsomia candida TaxID=158441 RepID=A0A226EVL2_FOLCA|nr:uncharacterized protein LOC118433858 isoform X2 [Folsomia candida]OXA61240.1 hypothetical protein Fcan01_02685 [Folsomia candida]